MILDGKGTSYGKDDEILLSVSTTLYAQWDMTVPSNGTALTVSLPEGKTSFKIYDAGGYNTPYGANYHGKLTLEAPLDHVIYLTGTIATEALVGGQAHDYLIVRDGDTGAAIMSNDRSTDVAGIGHVFVSTTDGVEKSMGRLLGTSSQMTIEFYSDGQNNFTGLNLTATVMSKDISLLGQGTAENPFKIEYADDLDIVEEYIQASHNTDIYIQQVADVDLEGGTLVPLAAGEASFAGHYDGGGYVRTLLSATSKTMLRRAPSPDVWAARAASPTAASRTSPWPTTTTLVAPKEPLSVPWPMVLRSLAVW